MTATLEATDIVVDFDGLRAVDGVSLRVQAGAVVGVIGPNGAGKTTLFNVISGLQRPTSGSVHLDGRDITALPPHARARLGMGRSFQNVALMPKETVETNVLAGQFLQAGYAPLDPILRPRRWVRAERDLRDRMGTTLRALQLEHNRHKLVADLSFGNSRFVELATVLMLSPNVLLLDEPTTGLDLGSIERLHDLLASLRSENKSVLLVAHNVSFVMGLCDWVYVVAGGRPLVDGPPAEVQHDPAVVEAYLGIEETS